MENRRMVGQPQVHVMDHEQLWNYPHPDPRLNSGLGSFMHPSEIIAVCGPNSISYSNPLSATNYPALPNCNLEAPCYMSRQAGITQQPYMHNSSAHSSSQFPSYSVQREPCFNQLTSGNINGVANPLMGLDIDAYKGRIRIFPETGSSSSHAASAGLFESNPPMGPHSLAWDPITMAYRSHGLLPYEEEQRNIRSRHVNVLQPENISLTIHSSNNFSDHFSTLGLNVPGQWNHAPLLDPQIRLISSDRPAHVLVAGQGTYGHGISYRANVGYRSMGSEANLVDVRLPAVERVVPPRHSRQLSTIGHANERNGRLRTRYHGDEEIGHGSWVSENLAVMERSTFYDSTIMFDDYQGMRLDIDNMSYEELLALEERIGNVNTGLSEVALSRFLMETIYCSDQALHDCQEGRCTICLEAYNDGDFLGRLNCGHHFHAFCIKKWLLIKNSCPMCKARALDDSIIDQ